ncbi:MAG: class I SAM-dependent methyltransferase [Actinomycetes bacterium]
MPSARTLRNVARNALRPSYLPVMVGKVRARLRPTHRDEALAWAAEHAESVDTFASAIDADLWVESGEWAAAFEVHARAVLATVGVPLGGGGHHRLLHFLTRLRRPTTVVETGVAAGWSSAAVLAALEANGAGTLYSSDFPYFRLEDPERYVGCVVPDALRAGWHLHTRGDRANLAEILPVCGPIGLFHYDSDKSAEGRTFGWETVAPHLTVDAVVVFDDIDDNTWFRDWVTADSRPFRVFERGGKYVGLTGL